MYYINIVLFIFYLTAKCKHIVNDANVTANGTLASFFKKIIESQVTTRDSFDKYDPRNECNRIQAKEISS